jgi:hypothetical protein
LTVELFPSPLHLELARNTSRPSERGKDESLSSSCGKEAREAPAVYLCEKKCGQQVVRASSVEGKLG